MGGVSQVQQTIVFTPLQVELELTLIRVCLSTQSNMWYTTGDNNSIKTNTITIATVLLLLLMTLLQLVPMMKYRECYC